MTTDETLLKKCWEKKNTDCLLSFTFPFALWSNKRFKGRHRDGGMWTMTAMVPTSTLGPNSPKGQAKDSSVCVEKSCREWVSGPGGDIVLWRGPVLGWTWRVTERDQGLRMKETSALSSVFGRLRAAVGTIVTTLICIHLAGALRGSAGQRNGPVV